MHQRPPAEHAETLEAHGLHAAQGRTGGQDLESLRGAGKGQRATMWSQPSIQEIWLRGLARREWRLRKDLATGEKAAATPRNAAARGRHSLPLTASRAPPWAALVSTACAHWPPISGFPRS